MFLQKLRHNQRMKRASEHIESESEVGGCWGNKRSTGQVTILGKWTIQFSSVSQLCPTFCDPMDCSTPGFLSITSSRRLLKLMSIKSVMPSRHLILRDPLLALNLPASGSFLKSWFFASRGQSIGVSASASVLPMNIQDWFPLGLTALISLQSKGLSRVFSNTTVQKQSILQCSAFFIAQLSHPNN